MELRKNPKIDLERKRGMFLSIGLCISVSFVLMAFQWTTEVAVVDIIDEEIDDGDFTTVIDPVITYMEQPKRPEPIAKKKIVSLENIVETKDEETIEEELLVQIEEPEIDFDAIVGDEVLPVEKAEVIFEVVETAPQPVGGMNAFYAFLSKEMKYPRRARLLDISGKVFVQFVISKSGEISDVKVIKGIGGGCDEEAKRVVSASANWNPGKQRGRPVSVRMVVPVFFRLR